MPVVFLAKALFSYLSLSANVKLLGKKYSKCCCRSTLNKGGIINNTSNHLIKNYILKIFSGEKWWFGSKKIWGPIWKMQVTVSYNKNLQNINKYIQNIKNKFGQDWMWGCNDTPNFHFFSQTENNVPIVLV